ncbi:hypothetical protein T492DRAFT_910268 [Pavlovales sp. CCMP2436]|nr:hypothetical protein T492DRAFT_910268 [Pavlovales sp. CCMP2436]
MMTIIIIKLIIMRMTINMTMIGPWVGNCIGLHNYRLFLSFLLVALLFTEALSLCPAAFLLTIYTSVVFLLLSMLFSFHAYLISINETTNENVKDIYYDGNPFSESCAQNWHTALCLHHPAHTLPPLEELEEGCESAPGGELLPGAGERQTREMREEPLPPVAQLESPLPRDYTESNMRRLSAPDIELGQLPPASHCSGNGLSGNTLSGHHSAGGLSGSGLSGSGLSGSGLSGSGQHSEMGSPRSSPSSPLAAATAGAAQQVGQGLGGSSKLHGDENGEGNGSRAGSGLVCSRTRASDNEEQECSEGEGEATSKPLLLPRHPTSSGSRGDARVPSAVPGDFLNAANSRGRPPSSSEGGGAAQALLNAGTPARRSNGFSRSQPHALKKGATSGTRRTQHESDTAADADDEDVDEDEDGSTRRVPPAVSSRNRREPQYTELAD